LRINLGATLLSRVQNSKIFLIGVGALGCELLKNYTMLGLGTKSDGKIYITDPDTIENSNLSRQFLFREKHIRKPKASTAAASVIQMNPDMKETIVIRLEKVCDATENIFDNIFLEKIDVVTNALDNVNGRKYVDQRCLRSRIPLIDSGTLGAKGHVQVIFLFFYI
jgi:molybdopterin/thiamine biosynthesis adenylyltransferase